MDLEQRIAALEEQIARMNTMKYRYSDRDVYTKAIVIKAQGGTRAGRFILEKLSADPSTGEEGELVYVNGKLKICTAGGSSPTWTIVGTQT